MNYHRVLIILCLFVTGSANAAGSLSENARAALLTEIELNGSSSIIVEYANTGSLASLQGEAQATFIQSMHQGFVNSLPESMAETVTHAFSYVPGTVMSVDKAQLQEVRNNPLVKHIYQNKARRTSLAQSVDIVLPGSAKDQYSGKGQAIAVLDTGVDRTHSFFSTDGINRVVAEACYSGGGFSSAFREVVRLCPNGGSSLVGPGSGRDCTARGFPGCNHGTHVAGIAAGNDGVANEAEIIAVQVFTGVRDVFRRNVCGIGVGRSCALAFDSDIIRGLERVFALRNSHNIAAVNMSLGGGRYFSSCNSQNGVMTRIINQLKAAGIATVIASGNNGFSTSIGFPACISSAVAVGATSDFTGSVFGNSVTKDERVFYSNHSSTVDLFAPGTLIRSSVPGNQFSNFNGTSMAAPHVAGAFAVVKAENNLLSVAEIESTFKSVGPSVSHSGVSRRRIDIVGALRKLGLFNSVPLTPILQLLMLDSSE